MVSEDTIAPPNFVIVFYKGRLPARVVSDLRSALISDERGSNEFKAFREKRIHIVSTWAWNCVSRTATFWLREDVMLTMKKEDWQVCICRSDDWSPQSSAYDFSYAGVKDLGISWVQRVNGDAVANAVTAAGADTDEDKDGDWSDSDGSIDVNERW